MKERFDEISPWAPYAGVRYLIERMEKQTPEAMYPGQIAVGATDSWLRALGHLKRIKALMDAVDACESDDELVTVGWIRERYTGARDNEVPGVSA